MKESSLLNVICNPGLDPKNGGGKSYKTHYWDNWWDLKMDSG